MTDGRTLCCSYLVGCDGGRSRVRKMAGIQFTGSEPQTSHLIFEAAMADDPPLGIRYGERGLYALGRFDDGPRVRGVATETHLERGKSPIEEDLKVALAAGYGSDLGVNEVTWVSQFTDAARQAEAYRKGRILLAGDAAHVHSPVGGPGLNVGMQDAVNLGWKLAQVVKGISSEAPPGHLSRGAAPGRSGTEQTLALAALNRGDDRTTALRGLMAKVMQMDEPRKWYTATMSGLDIRCGEEGTHRLLGRRMPDMDISTGEGPTRIFKLLHEARRVLANFGTPGPLSVDRWGRHVRLVDARFEGVCELPVIGAVPSPLAVLIRPDGHVAWVGDGTDAGLINALGTWCGD